MNEDKILKWLEYIDPSMLDRSEWIKVGMALKSEGYDFDVFDDWSARDYERYNRKENLRQWNTLADGKNGGVTGGTLFNMAKMGGYMPENKGADIYARGAKTFDFGDNMTSDAAATVKTYEPAVWRPIAQVVEFLEAVFESGDLVNYNMRSLELEDKPGKFVPQGAGIWKERDALLAELRAAKELPEAMGDNDPGAGAWIKMNPVDGIPKGSNSMRDANITAYRHALVECDDMTLAEQERLLRASQLPISALIYSGGKSIHAVVKVDAGDAMQYKKRVEYLYDACEKMGLAVDRQDKNPSRYTRLPGVVRRYKKQYIIATHIGFDSWDAWEEWYKEKELTAALPKIESFADFWEEGNRPEPREVLIEGMLKKGGKMFISGCSKAGKSWAAIELAVAIAEGKKWLERWQCKQGKVLYLNLEIMPDEFVERVIRVYESLDMQPSRNLDIQTLRGYAMPLEALAPSIIAEAKDRGYAAIIIDPIYKLGIADENSAGDVAKFCNVIDAISTDLDCSIIYVHHHSKGMQSGKRAIDRASGSGVFARDADAMIDMLELDFPEDLRRELVEKRITETGIEYLDAHISGWRTNAPGGILSDRAALVRYAAGALEAADYEEFCRELDHAENKALAVTALAVEGTFRSFPPLVKPVNIFFEYPIHKLDRADKLKNAEAADAVRARGGGDSTRKKEGGQEKGNANSDVKKAIDENINKAAGCSFIADVARELQVKDARTIKKLVNNLDGYHIERRGNKDVIVPDESEWEPVTDETELPFN